jgi:hypothetical protein
MALGVLGLLAAIVQHIRILKDSRDRIAYSAIRAIAIPVATMLILIGIFGLPAILW